MLLAFAVLTMTDVSWCWHVAWGIPLRPSFLWRPHADCSQQAGTVEGASDSRMDATGITRRPSASQETGLEKTEGTGKQSLVLFPKV